MANLNMITRDEAFTLLKKYNKGRIPADVPSYGEKVQGTGRCDPL